MEDRIYEYWAATIQDGYIGNLIDIVERAGGAKSLYYMTSEDMLNKLGLTKRMASHISDLREGIDIEKNYVKMINDGISYVNYKDSDFPSRLLEISSCPYGLFVKGSLPDANRKSVAIIGARECSEYGRLMAEYLGDKLAKSGINVISGMAWGIDGIAQMATLRAGGLSYGVLGCGPDVVYPRKNIEVYERLLENGNGVISEYAPGMEAKAQRFPPRNRIIAGLSDAVIVVEARAKSGTLITVEMAVDQGKTIMVVPGRLTDPLSVGCLKLIKEGAVPITCFEDVLEEIGEIEADKNKGKSEMGINSKKEKELNLTSQEKKVFNLISLDGLTPDFIADKLTMPIEEVLVILTNLEMKSLIKEEGSFKFIRNITLT